APAPKRPTGAASSAWSRCWTPTAGSWRPATPAPRPGPKRRAPRSLHSAPWAGDGRPLRPAERLRWLPREAPHLTSPPRCAPGRGGVWRRGRTAMPAPRAGGAASDSVDASSPRSIARGRGTVRGLDAAAGERGPLRHVGGLVGEDDGLADHRLRQQGAEGGEG